EAVTEVKVEIGVEVDIEVKVEIEIVVEKEVAEAIIEEAEIDHVEVKDHVAKEASKEALKIEAQDLEVVKKTTEVAEPEIIIIEIKLFIEPANAGSFF
ncbi:MAG: hypothetical protein JXR64_13030, partial [Spirochaetales bacterium]|nr:hypothetical protein [Spirochaetales bacterium]